MLSTVHVISIVGWIIAHVCTSKVTSKSAAPPPQESLSFSKRGLHSRAVIRKMTPMPSMVLPRQPASGASAPAICRAPCNFICLPPPGVHSGQTKELTLVAQFSTYSQASLEKGNSQCPQTYVRSVLHHPSTPPNPHPISTFPSGKVALWGPLLVVLTRNSVGPARYGHTAQHTVGVH